MSPSPRIRHNAKISNNLRSISFKLPRGEYPNGSEGIRKTWWRSIDRDSRPDRFRLVARVSRGISRIEKIKKKERRRERERRRKRKIKGGGEEDCGRSRRSQLSATFPLIVLLFREDFFPGESISDDISRERKYPSVSRLFLPLPMKSASVGPLTFSAIPS